MENSFARQWFKQSPMRKRRKTYGTVYHTDGCRTQRHRDQRIRNCSEKERMTVEELMPLVAEGKVAICANKHHTCIDPEGVGINVTHEDQCQSRCIERLQGL